MTEKNEIRPEIFRALHKLAVCDSAAPRPDSERCEKPGHIPVGKFAKAPIVADRAAHEFAARPHPEIAVPAYHQVVNEKYSQFF